jgi:hypothetical protein
MRASITCFWQVAQNIKLINIPSIVKEFGTDKWYKTFSTEQHLITMCYAQLSSVGSLRELENGMALFGGGINHMGFQDYPSRSTIAYANENRDYRVFEEFYYKFLNKARSALQFSTRGKPVTRFRFKPKLYSIDSSTIELTHSVFDWADYRKTKGGIKLHTMLEHSTFLPSWVLITNARGHDKKALDSVDPVRSLARGSMVVVDRGYNDYAMLKRWDELGMNFFCRAKDNMRFVQVGSDRPVPRRVGRPSASGELEEKGDHVISDQIILLSSPRGQMLYPGKLRLITFYLEEKPKGRRRKHGIVRFFTNNMKLSAATIAAVYKARWQIETFFRLIKQKFKLKTFLGTSANAVKIQVYTALLSPALLRYWQALARGGWSCCCISHLMAQLRLCLHLYKDLEAWLSRTRAKPPPKPQEPLMQPTRVGRLF